MHAKKSLSEKINNEKITGLLCVSPFIFGFFLFLLVPMAISLYYAFCEYNILSPAKFIGLANFKRMLTDETFFKALKVTLTFPPRSAAVFPAPAGVIRIENHTIRIR